MPIKVKQNLPARDILENENIFVIDGHKSNDSGYPSVEGVGFKSYANKDCNRNSDS